MEKNTFSFKKLNPNLDFLIEFTTISPDFYFRSDVAAIARDLIGKVLISNFDGQFSAGMIVETEAYSGMNDRACHAHNKKRTPRTQTMFLPGGHAYVYLCYGLHHLFNVVTNQEGEPDAVLIRALQPLVGMELMASRRGLKPDDVRLTRGPACLSQAMGITRDSNAIDLKSSPTLWLAAPPPDSTVPEIVTSARIGVDYAGEDALKPWRFFWKGNCWVSGTFK